MKFKEVCSEKREQLINYMKANNLTSKDFLLHFHAVNEQGEEVKFNSAIDSLANGETKYKLEMKSPEKIKELEDALKDPFIYSLTANPENEVNFYKEIFNNAKSKGLEIDYDIEKGAEDKNSSKEDDGKVKHIILTINQSIKQAQNSFEDYENPKSMILTVALSILKFSLSKSLSKLTKMLSNFKSLCKILLE